MKKKEWLDAIRMYDGCEVPVIAWPVVEELEREGMVSLGPARGPDGGWRRAKPIEERP